MLPDADYLYACDQKWWQHHITDIRNTFKGELYTQWHNQGAKDFAESQGINALPSQSKLGLGMTHIFQGNNSGYQAINLAWLLADRDGYHPRIILLGFDMGATGGKNHWFGDHPNGMTNGPYEQNVTRFTQLADDLVKVGVEVINCTRQTNLHQFKRDTIDNVI